MVELIQSETFRKWLTDSDSLLCGGDKRTQNADIKRAKQIAAQWT